MGLDHRTGYRGHHSKRDIYLAPDAQAHGLDAGTSSTANEAAQLMKTVHLVYPHGDRISCPDAIGRELAVRLRERYNVVLHDWDDTDTIEPGGADVLIGHPHPKPWTCFRRSMRRGRWGRVIILCPYNPGDEVHCAFLDPIVRNSDCYLAITGNYWFSSITTSMFAHWLPKMVHVDLAVNRGDFPAIKPAFNPPGKRKFVYIGGTYISKNLGYLSEIAGLLRDEAEFAWVGEGQPAIAGLKHLGFQDFRTASAREIIAQYDFLITVGRADANPATILEAMAWGLIPVCTPQSGYVRYPGIINVPLDDAAGAASILRELQGQPDEQLRSLQEANWALLDSHFSWDRVAAQAVAAIEGKSSPPVSAEPWDRKLALRWAAVRSPHFYLRPDRIARFARKCFSNLRCTIR
jgi:glycosyltransferase involved in cell wall biosynthesis